MMMVIADFRLLSAELNSDSENPDNPNKCTAQQNDQQLTFCNAAELILSLQNKDGGWASYELTRAPRWIELLNPSEIFGNIMIDYSYTECTSACVQSLVKFREHYPEYRNSEIKRSIKRGIQFILSQQRDDGSWYGSWAVCFTYGTWFAIEALSAFLKSGIDVKKSSVIKTALRHSENF